MKNIIKESWLGPSHEAFTRPKVSLWFLQAQIRWKYGEKVADNFKPDDVKTFTRWWFERHKVRLGEKALRGVILVPSIDEGNERTIRKPKVVYLYHRLQVIKMQ